MSRKNRTRALRNLFLTAVLCFAAWIVMGAPLPTEELRMHRAERESLAERSQIVWRYTSVDFLDRDEVTLVGVTPTQVHIYGWLTVWARNPDGPTLVCLPMYLEYPDAVGGTRGLLAVDPPAGAESARLTVTLETEYGLEIDRTWYSEEYQEESVRDGECFFFSLTRHHPNQEDPLWGPEHALFAGWKTNYDDRGYFAAPYTLEFFDGDGELIQSFSNT